MDDVWVCATCKSINRARDSRCYSCHGPRDDAIGEGGAERRTIDAIANRTVRPYLPSWPLAILAGGLLVAVAVLGVLLLLRTADGFPAIRDAFMRAIDGGGPLDPTIMDGSIETAGLGLLRTGLVALALLSFAGWLALATMNVPALGGGVPSRGPIRVFIYTLIPLWNLFKVPGMVQDVLYRLDAQAGGAWMVMAATIGLLGSWFVNLIGSWIIIAAGVGTFASPDITRQQAVDAFSSILDQTFYLSVVVELMITVGTLLVVALMIRIEARVQARNRDIKAAVSTLASGGPLDAPPAGPAATAATTAPAAVPAAATTPPFASAPRPATPTAFDSVAPVTPTPFRQTVDRPSAAVPALEPTAGSVEDDAGWDDAPLPSPLPPQPPA